MAIYTKRKPLAAKQAIGLPRFDGEGRILQLEYKLGVYDRLLKYLGKLKNQNRLNARQRNLGWRIDYFFVSQPLTRNLEDAFILPEVIGSDHCPVGIEITF